MRNEYMPERDPLPQNRDYMPEAEASTNRGSRDCDSTYALVRMLTMLTYADAKCQRQRSARKGQPRL